MTAKEKVQQGLDARKDVKAAEAETAKVIEDLEEAGHELVRLKITHETDKASWKREKAKLQDLLVEECDKNRKLAAELVELTRESRERKLRVALISTAQTSALFIVLAVCRELGLIHYWLANGLLFAAALYLIVSAFVMLRKHK